MKLLFALCAFLVFPPFATEDGYFSEWETERIGTEADLPMRVLTTDDPCDSAFLRLKAEEITDHIMLEEGLYVLIRRMLNTVRDPANPGVGIAAPQVGISRRLIIVQRFDKQEGDSEPPFVIFFNPVILEYGDKKIMSTEGCLSIPDFTGEVPRSVYVVVEYNHPASFQRIREEVRGFTAIIFQHEIDHLNGILFTDYIGQEAENNRH